MTSRILGIALLAALTLTATVALAHEDAVLRSTLSAVAAGDTLPLSGADFSPDVSYGLQLLGALREYDVRSVESKPDGTLEIALSIPRDVVPGAYKLVAIAPDGDRVASLDLTILEPAATPLSKAGKLTGGGEGSHGQMRDAARADEIPIERSRSGAEWAVIGLVIGLAAGLGVTSIRRGGQVS